MYLFTTQHNALKTEHLKRRIFLKLYENILEGYNMNTEQNKVTNVQKNLTLGAQHETICINWQRRWNWLEVVWGGFSSGVCASSHTHFKPGFTFSVLWELNWSSPFPHAVWILNVDVMCTITQMHTHSYRAGCQCDNSTCFRRSVALQLDGSLLPSNNSLW